jgi:WD40 repeat protein
MELAFTSEKSVHFINPQSPDTILKTIELSRQCLSIAFSPDSSTLTMLSNDAMARFYILSSDRLTDFDYGSPVRCVAFSPDGLFLAIGLFNGIIRLEFNEGVSLLKDSPEWIHSIAFSPDGSILAIGCMSGRIKLHYMDDGETRILFKQGYPIYSVVFSPDGSTLAWNSDDQRIQLWNLNTGENQVFGGHDGDRVVSLAFSPDGSTLASGGDSGSIKLWDLSGDKTVRTIKDEDGHGIWGLAFRPESVILL